MRREAASARARRARRAHMRRGAPSELIDGWAARLPTESARSAMHARTRIRRSSRRRARVGMDDEAAQATSASSASRRARREEHEADIAWSH